MKLICVTLFVLLSKNKPCTFLFHVWWLVICGETFYFGFSPYVLADSVDAYYKLFKSLLRNRIPKTAHGLFLLVVCWVL